MAPHLPQEEMPRVYVIYAASFYFRSILPAFFPLLLQLTQLFSGLFLKLNKLTPISVAIPYDWNFV